MSLTSKSEIIVLKDKEWLVRQKIAGRVVAKAHQEIYSMLKGTASSLTILKLNDMVEDLIRSNNCTPTFLNYRGFPSTICASLNNELVHGFGTRDIILRDGDVLKVDIGATFEGAIGDCAVTYVYGKVKNPEIGRMLVSCQGALYDAINLVEPGRRIGELGRAIFGAEGQDFEDVVVPDGNVLGEVGKGFKVAMEVLNSGRLGLAAGCVGASRRLIQMAVERVQERRAFGRPIGQFGLIQDKIATMVAETFAIESMTYLTSGLVDRHVADYSLESAICKVYASETLWRIVNETLTPALRAGNNDAAVTAAVDRHALSALNPPSFDTSWKAMRPSGARPAFAARLSTPICGPANTGSWSRPGMPKANAAAPPPVWKWNCSRSSIRRPGSMCFAPPRRFWR